MSGNYPPKCAPGFHEWIFVQFSYAGWTECATCAFRPEDEDEFDRESSASA